MKIGIVTNYSNINYGSALQSYALQCVLRDLGHEPENIRYQYDKKVPIQNRVRTVLGRCKRSLLCKPHRKDAFYKFRKNYIIESDTNYVTLKELQNSNDVYDVFLCGSDQIWAPNQFHEWYYLSFVNSEKLKIAYAPSIGLPSIPAALCNRMAELLGRIDFISIRERQGRDIVKRLTGQDVPIVLDPTLLLTEENWKKVLITSVVKGKYAFCYLLGNNPVHRIMARKYCDERNLQLVAPYENGDMQQFDSVLTCVGPREFLGLIRDASVVLTDSFHGSVFALQFKKELFSFLRFSENDQLCQNSRIFNLYEEIGLEGRILKDNEYISGSARAMDYPAIDAVLEKSRKKSVGFLQRALNADNNIRI